MRDTLPVLAISSAVALPAISSSTVIYPIVAAAFVALAAVAHRFLLARAGFRRNVRRLA